MTQYVIWSNEHRSWWAPHSRGYTKNITQAGLYSQDEATKIVAEATMGQWLDKVPDEIAIRISDLPCEARVLLGFE